MNLLNDVKTTCQLLSMSRTHLYEEIKRGRIAPVKSGTKTLFHKTELERYAASLARSEHHSTLNLDVVG